MCRASWCSAEVLSPLNSAPARHAHVAHRSRMPDTLSHRASAWRALTLFKRREYLLHGRSLGGRRWVCDGLVVLIGSVGALVTTPAESKRDDKAPLAHEHGHETVGVREHPRVLHGLRDAEDHEVDLVGDEPGEPALV